jgi:hypothetical protein
MSHGKEYSNMNIQYGRAALEAMRVILLLKPDLTWPIPCQPKPSLQ